ncbi:ParA family protein [Rhodococcus opacus]|uniref:ParA family protein n=1 Tax=Rhodococcus opacus TaxID=37919 RepID=UPI0002E903CE|nr:ParA family protein [Rhodococcus opacus]AHK35570.1 Sporulation initiation inhibitor protein soj [Rhodococcus opacus PD630]UDH01733.1 ParA family protein [Rhodococcus opacus PD630]
MTARHQDGTKRALILALCNQKGGVGKTTTTFHLARAAVLRGLRVLLIDMDPQGNLTKISARERVAKKQLGVADVLTGDSDYILDDVIVEGRWADLSLAPTSGRKLINVRNELVAADLGRELRLRKAVAGVREEYDLILIDCPPSVDLLTINALAAADEAVIITETSLFGADGIEQLLSTIGDVREYFHPNLEVRGAVVNNHESQTISGGEWLDTLKKSLTVLEPIIPHRVVIKDSSQAGTGLDEWGTTRATLTAMLYAELLPALIGERHATTA